MLHELIFRKLRRNDVVHLLRIIASGIDQPFLTDGRLHVNVPNLVTDFVVMRLDQKGGFYDEQIGILALLLPNLPADLRLH